MIMTQTVKCEFWDNGTCKQGFYGGRPSPSVCTTHCPVYLKANGREIQYESVADSPKPKTRPQRQNVKPKHVGFGDTVKWAIEKVSFGRIKQKKGCGCAKRQSWLNRRLPYRLPKWMKKGQ